MSIRVAELVFAVILAVCSALIMLKSTDGLSIGWVPEKGPGSGVWPFWLSLGMFLSCVAVIVQWFRGATPESLNNAPFISLDGLKIVGTSVLALVFLLGATHIIGIYFAMMLFLVFYLRVMGSHTWLLTIVLALATPTFLFFFFEGALVIPLPKGYSEPLFYPLYDLIY